MTVQHLLSLPSAMAAALSDLEGRTPPDWFATSDPPGASLGSGGATVQVLIEGWRATSGGRSFAEWLRQSRKLIIHGGGQSRRLPAYAVVGKPLLPVPVFRWSRGQRLDQTLLDLQAPDYRRVLDQAPAKSAVLVASGDVLLRFGGRLPSFPEVDVLGLGMPLPPEQAAQFGVFFCTKGRPGLLEFFLQKPSPERIRELMADHDYWVDTGMWLLSERAIEVLLRKTGTDPDAGVDPSRVPGHYELYAGFGLGLGERPVVDDAAIRGLASAVVALPEPEFYHLGTSQQLVESMSLLQNRGASRGSTGFVATWRHPDQFILNSKFGFGGRRETHHTLWVENSMVPSTWQLACRHVLTNVPDNGWSVRLEEGVCLDFVPVGATAFALRFYGMNDAFRGPVGDPATTWLERPVVDWFTARGINFDEAGVRRDLDLQSAPLFPIGEIGDDTARWLEWLLAARPEACAEFARRWRESERVSADQLAQRVNLARLYRQRSERRAAGLGLLARRRGSGWFFRLDLAATAGLLAASSAELPAAEGVGAGNLDPMLAVREEMMQAAWLRARGAPGGEEREAAAFARLRELIEREVGTVSAVPRCCLQEDQIVWGRSPVRLDLAGGWTDTPPYCLENGGRVVNVAVDLNGQPPLQVFARLCPRREIVIRSIDLGVEQRVESYEALGTFAQPGSEFALAKAALALAGFLPRFHGQGGYRSLAAQLEDFGGGLEISLLAAVPKGSGLGTSSILAATLLGVLSDLCGLNWDRHVLFGRTLALEQLMTTGGGWQDQAGGIFRGVKQTETAPDLAQRPTLRWLPEHLFGSEYANQRILLYYTGLTRLAKGILHEVVRGVFLNSPEHLSTLAEIGANAGVAFAALQQLDYEGLTDAVRTSWELNQRLDQGTNPAAVRQMLESVQDYLGACKLLGAGGGGYLLMLAKDAEAAGRIRRVLSERSPNAKARFVDFAVSPTGLQVTRS